MFGRLNKCGVFLKLSTIRWWYNGCFMALVEAISGWYFNCTSGLCSFITFRFFKYQCFIIMLFGLFCNGVCWMFEFAFTSYISFPLDENIVSQTMLWSTRSFIICIFSWLSRPYLKTEDACMKKIYIKNFPKQFH